MDTDLNETLFPKNITMQLLKIVKNLQKWEIAKIGEEECDYYQYVTFVIENVYVKEILP